MNPEGMGAQEKRQLSQKRGRFDGLLRLLSLLIPRAQREEWRRQWSAELRHHQVMEPEEGGRASLWRHAAGAVTDASALRLDLLREGWLLEGRLAWRGLWRRPLASGLMLLVLALGFGGSVLVGGLVDSVLLRPLPYPEAERLVRLWERNLEASLEQVPPASGNLLDFRRAGGLAALAGYYVAPRTVRATEKAEVISVAQVSADFFSVLGSPPLMGRTFTAEETARSVFNAANSPQGEDPVIVLSHGFWRSRMSGRASVVGETLELESKQWTVIGVMPESFAFPSREVLAWIPVSFAGEQPRDQRYLHSVARLAPGVDVEAAEDELTGLAAGLSSRFPQSNRGWGVELQPLHESAVGGVRGVLWVAFGAVVCMWLLATVNVAVLQLMRAWGRRSEVTLRRALGASTPRLMRLVMIDSLVPVALGGGLGVAAAHGVALWLRGTRLLDLPRLSELAIRPRVILFAALLAALTVLLTGLAPALLSARGRGRGRSRSQTGDRFSQHLRASLVVLEVALAMVLLTGAGLFAHSLLQIHRVDPGFDARQVLVAPVILDNNRYRGGAQSRAYYEEVMQRLKALPGVRSVGATTVMPMSSIGPDFDRPVWAEGQAVARGGGRPADMRMVTPDLFATLDIALLQGRDFGPEDQPESPAVTIVNARLAQHVWPGQDPVGRHLKVDMGPYGESKYEVVGVIENIRRRGLRQEPRPEFYVPHAQRPYLFMNLAIRVDGPVAAQMEPIREALLALDPDQPAHSVTALADLVADSVYTERLTALLVAVLGAIALLLAAVGVYGALAYWVDQRRRELGIRLALGAARAQISRRVGGLAAGLVGLGLLGGAALSLAAGPLVTELLFGLGPADPWSLAAASALLATAGVGATWIPLRRALLTDPADCLRHE